MSRHFKLIFAAILLTVLQTTILKFMSLDGIIPDLLLIFVVYISITQGQMIGSIYGFGIGLFFDIVTGGSIGLSSLSKSIGGFVAGYFFNENKIELTLSGYRFLLIVFLVSIIHNFIYILIYIQGSEINVLYGVLRIGITTSLYTTTVSIFLILLFSRKYAFKL